MASFSDDGTGGPDLLADAPIYDDTLEFDVSRRGRSGGALFFRNSSWAGVQLDTNEQSAETQILTNGGGIPYLAICAPDGGSFGVIESSGYGLQIRVNEQYLEIRRNGSGVDGSDFPLSGFTAGDVIKLESVMEGSDLRINVYRNGVLVPSCTYLDTSPLTGTWAWIGCGSGGPDPSENSTFGHFNASDNGPTLTVPAAIVDLVATPGDEEVALAFTAPDDGGASITDYVYEYRVTDVPAAPAFGTSTGESGTSLGSANAQPLPASAASGDLVIYVAGVDNTSTTDITGSTGWTAGTTVTQGSNVIKGRIFARVLDGTTGDNILSVTGPTQDYAIAAHRIASGQHGLTNATLAAWLAGHVTSTTGVSGNADPPNLGSLTSKNYLLLTAAIIDATTGNTISAVPTGGYTSRENRTSASSTSSVVLRTATRETSTPITSENPGAFTNTSRPWIAFTIAVPAVDIAWSTFSDGTSSTPGTTVTGLTNDQEYEFRVAAVNSVGQGPWSNIDTATPVSSGPTEVAVDVASLALAGVQPTIAPSSAAPLTADVGALTLIGVQPTVTVAPVVVAVDTAILSMSGIEPAWAPSSAATISVDTALLVLAGIDASVSAASVSLALDSAILALSGIEPPAAGVANTLDIDTAVLSMSALDITISSAPGLLSVDTAILALTGVQPDLAPSSGTSFDIDAANLIFVGVDLTLTAAGAVEQAITPGIFQLVGNDVGISGGDMITVEPAAISLTGVQPTISGTGAATVDVDAGVLDLSGIDPDVSGAVILDIDSGGLTFQGVDIDIAPSSGITAAIDTATFSLTGVDLTISGAGAVQVPVDSGTLDLDAIEPSLNAAAIENVDAGALQLTGVEIIASGTGSATASIDPATLALAGLDLPIQVGTTSTTIEPGSLLLLPVAPSLIPEGGISTTLDVGALMLTALEILGHQGEVSPVRAGALMLEDLTPERGLADLTPARMVIDLTPPRGSSNLT